MYPWGHPCQIAYNGVGARSCTLPAFSFTPNHTRANVTSSWALGVARGLVGLHSWIGAPQCLITRILRSRSDNGIDFLEERVPGGRTGMFPSPSLDVSVLTSGLDYSHHRWIKRPWSKCGSPTGRGRCQCHDSCAGRSSSGGSNFPDHCMFVHATTTSID